MYRSEWPVWNKHIEMAWSYRVYEWGLNCKTCIWKKNKEMDGKEVEVWESHVGWSGWNPQKEEEKYKEQKSSMKQLFKISHEFFFSLEIN